MSTIFSYQANEDYYENDKHVHLREELECVIKDYNLMFNKNFSTETFDAFFNVVLQRVKKGLPCERLDILIIVDMFLTGFDSKKVNTL